MVFKLKTLNVYIIRQILAPFFLVLTVLLMVLSLERLLRIVQVVTERNGSGVKVFELLFYLLPHYLGLALPAAMFLSVLLGVRRLQDDSELAVIQSSGISLRALYKPIAVIVIPTTIVMLLLVGYMQPHARYTYRTILNEISMNNLLGGLRIGTFYNIDEHTILRAERVQKQEGRLDNVFIAYKKQNPPEKIVIGAKAAYLSQDTDTRKAILRLENGNLIRENKDTKKISKLEFDSYPWTLPGLLNESYGPRGRDEREMNFQELMAGGVAGTVAEITEAQRKAEFHVRLTMALSLPFLALWALPLALIGSGRTGKAGGLVLGAVLLVFYEKLLGFGEAYVAVGSANASFALWLPWLILGISGWVMMSYKMPEKLKNKKPVSA